MEAELFHVDGLEAQLFHVDGQTDRHGEAHSHFSSILQTCLKTELMNTELQQSQSPTIITTVY